jgi:ribosome-binding ATPase YchF (GTP1/OBG family)
VQQVEGRRLQHLGDAGAAQRLEGVRRDVVEALALRLAERPLDGEGGVAVEYHSGDADFTVKGALSDAQRKGLDYIRAHALQPLGGTGVAKVLEEAAFSLLRLVPVYPVEDESKLTDKDGRVLPDCHLVPQGTTARQLAYRVHTDLGEHFIRAIDCRTKRAIGADHELKAGDVVKVVAKA